MDKSSELFVNGSNINELWSSVAGQIGFMAFYIGYLTKDAEDEQSRAIVGSLEKFLKTQNGKEDES